MKRLVNNIGWCGALATLTAYFMVSYDILNPHDWRYQILNLLGAIGLGILCYFKKAYQPLIVNIIWGIVAISVLARLFF